MLYTFTCINCGKLVTEQLDYRIVEVMIVLGGCCDFCCKLAMTPQWSNRDE